MCADAGSKQSTGSEGLSLKSWILRLSGRGTGRSEHGAGNGDYVQIQVFYQGEGWQNAGLAPADPRLLRRKLDEALARHGGEAARAIDRDGKVVEAG
jgi:hypothetical protein